MHATLASFCHLFIAKYICRCSWIMSGLTVRNNNTVSTWPYENFSAFVTSVCQILWYATMPYKIWEHLNGIRKLCYIVFKISIRCFYSIIVSVQVKLIWSKPSSEMLFFLSSLTALFLLYSVNTQTIAKWKKRVIWEICTLTWQIVVVWCGSRSGEWSSGSHGSRNIYLSQKWGTTSGKMKIINVPETVLQYWRTVFGTLIIFMCCYLSTDVRITP